MDGLAGRIILLSGWRRRIAAFAAGSFAVLALAPYDFPAAGFVSFPVLVWLLDGVVAPPRAGLLGRLAPSFGIGWWFGFGYFLMGLWWIGKAFLVEAEDIAWALPLAVVGLPAFLALFYGAATMLARLLWSDGAGRIASLAAAFGAAEWARGAVLTGFPWNATAYLAMPSPPLMQSVAVLGVHGMNILAVFVLASPALLAFSRGRRTGLALALTLVALHVGFGYGRLALAPADGLEAGKTLSLRVVQLSISQDEKWDPKVRDRVFARYIAQSAAASPGSSSPPSLVIWPETALPFLLADRPDALTAFAELLGAGQMLLTGAVRTEGKGEERRYYNSVLAIDDAGAITDAVDKVHLVPGGEFIPFAGLLSKVGLRKLAGSNIDFEAATEYRTVALPGGVKALPLICYEVIFPNVGGRAAEEADLVINLTNDAWFGDTPGPYQHFRKAQVQAVESGLPLVRAAGNGISAIVDPYGRVRDGLALNAVGALDATVGLTPTRLSLPWPRQLGWLAILVLFTAAALVTSLRGLKQLN